MAVECKSEYSIYSRIEKKGFGLAWMVNGTSVPIRRKIRTRGGTTHYNTPRRGVG